MTRTLALFLAAVTILPALFSSDSAAQNDDEKSYFGIRGAISLPNIVGGGDQEITRNYRSRTAANFGAFVEVGITKNLSIQPEVDFASQGGKRSGIQPITSPLPGLPPPPGQYYFGDFENTAILNYIEVPVMAKYTFVPDRNQSFYLLGGPYAGFLINAKTKTRGSSTLYIDNSGTPLLLPPANQPLPPISFDADTDVTDSIKRFNFGITAGGGVKFRHSSKNHFFVEARGAYGLTTIQRDPVTAGESHTGNLLISFGYAFGLGK
ncbi:MAG: PorT family protein [Chloracidobacterium sp.]|nr:PorT family protein [Chloracidobacterium sp.]